MIFRNSIKSIYRSIGKTTLFTLLIFALTLALSLAMSVWVAVEQFLDDCDEFYTTIGVLEYRGTEYPGDTNYEPAMAEALQSFDYSVIANDEATLMWESPSRSFGYVDGFWRSDAFMPMKSLSVFVVGSVVYSEEDQFYTAVVYKTLYSSIINKNKQIYIDEDFGSFDPNHFYLVLGEVYHGRSPIYRLGVSPFEQSISDSFGKKLIRKLDITAEREDDFYTLPEESILLQVADSLNVINNSVLINGTNNLMANLPFHEQELYFVDGRTFTEAEYLNGEKVAVISDLMAKRLEISIGDHIDLSASVSDVPGIYNSYWVEDGFSFQDEFTVIGIINTINDKSWYIYVPQSSGVPYTQFPVGYTVGYAVLDNEKALDFYIRTDPLMNNRLQLEIYDEGYSSTAIPYQTILRTSQIVAIVCLIVDLAVTILFGFLYIYRQRETSETMLKLGAGKNRIIAYFLFSAGLIALVAISAGAYAGYKLHDQVISWVAQSTDNFSLIDARYSNGNLTVSKTLEFMPNLTWHLFLYVGAIIFLFVILTCLFFTVGTFQNNKQIKSLSSGPKREHKTSHLSGGSGKFALLSIFRGSTRSLVVPLLATAVVIFLGNLSSTTIHYSEQLEDITSNTTIEGYFTDINGKQIGNLILSAYNIRNFYSADFQNSLSLSRNLAYLYHGVSRYADGTENPLEPLYVPRNSFVRESIEATIERGPDMVFTNNIRTSPEFYFADTIVMNFMEGYDESFLSISTNDFEELSCIITSSLMEEQNIQLGDTIQLIYYGITRNPEDGLQIYTSMDARVIGTFEKQGAADTIYLPLSSIFDTNVIWDPEQSEISFAENNPDPDRVSYEDHVQLMLDTSFQSANFTLKDSHDLIQFKDYLIDYGFSQVREAGSIREFIVIKDSTYNSTIASITQQIQYINFLYPFLYVLVGIIAITASYLLVVHRKGEFAIHRGLGSTRIRTFFSFFLEQIVLCIFGIGAGFLLWHLIWGNITLLHLEFAAGFAFCFFLGSAISIMIMNHSNVLTILLDRE